MSDAPESIDEKTAKSELDASEVAKFLEQNSAFFEDNRELLTSLSIPHQSGGSISLIERQVASLREENSQLKKQLSTLINHAHDNDSLFEKTRTLTLQIIRSRDYAQLRECVESAMVNDFNATVCRLWRLGDDGASSPSIAPETLDATLPRLAEIGIFCGILKEEESALLFEDQAEQAGSAAILLLRDPAGDPLGVLAIANEDRDYYRDNMSTSMLSYIAEVVAVTIEISAS